MDRKEFGNLILENERQLYRIAKSILRSDEDCADAAQEAVMKAFEKLHTLRDDRYAKTWLIRILINECFRMADKQKRERMLADKVKSCEEQANEEARRTGRRLEEMSGRKSTVNFIRRWRSCRGNSVLYWNFIILKSFP